MGNKENEEQIAKLSKKLYDEVLEEFYREDNTRSITEIVNEKIASFNDEAGAIIEASIYAALGDAFTKEIPNIIPSSTKLSSMLYKNGKSAARETLKILKNTDKGADFFEAVGRKLYEGYGFRTEEVLGVRRKAPLYVQRYLSRRTTQRQFEREINRIKTKTLRVAYQRIAELSQKHNDSSVRKAMKVALEEKSRYYANRIAVTETQRAHNLARAKEFLDDDDIEFVKYRMNSRHPMFDICDYYANLDVGYGKGIVPKEKMITLPLHPHCMCRYDPYYKPVKKHKPKDPLESMTKRQQMAVLGGWTGWTKWKSGKSPESIFNIARPKYKITEIKEFLEYDVAMDIRTMLDEVKNRKKLTKNKVVVGTLNEKVIAFLKDRGVAIHTIEIYLTSKGLSHLARDSKKKRGAGLSDDDILKIPHILESPDYLYFDAKKDKLNLLYCSSADKCDDIIKIVVDTNSIDKKYKKITLIKTAGYIKRANLMEYIKIY